MMMGCEDFWSELATELRQTYDLASKPYEIPRLPEAQCIVVPLVREAIAPIVVRNNEAEEVTDQVIAEETRIRMIASKTKGVERRRGAQILRALNLGGKAAVNKVVIPNGRTPGSVFDLNSFVFGDSAQAPGGKKMIYPVHAAVLYSDAISVAPKRGQVESVFRHGGVYEDGGNFDAEDKKSSPNIFTTYAVKPGTLFVQTAVFLGHRVTRAAFEHWLLAVGLVGAYGGMTAVTGTNLRTRLGGVYWGTLERDINAPAEILKRLKNSKEAVRNPNVLLDKIQAIFSEVYPKGIGWQEVEGHIAHLVRQLEDRQDELVKRYREASEQIRELFDAWFGRSAQTRRGRQGRGRDGAVLQEDAVDEEAEGE